LAGCARVGVSKTALAAALVAVVALAGVAAYVVMAPSGQATSTHTLSSTSSSTSTLSAQRSVTVTAVPPSPLISPGETQNYSSILVSAAGSEANATLTVRAFPPSGLSLVLNQTSVPLTEVAQSIPIVLKASPGISPGNYTVTIETSSSAVAASNETFKVQVVPMLVIMQDLAFHPANITVARGTQVTWLNLDSTIGCCDPGYHTVSFLSGANATSPVLKLFYSWSYTFGTDGVVDYYCTIHPFMKGQVTVNG
jgi:plastocyanin